MPDNANIIQRLADAQAATVQTMIASAVADAVAPLQSELAQTQLERDAAEAAVAALTEENAALRVKLAALTVKTKLAVNGQQATVSYNGITLCNATDFYFGAGLSQEGDTIIVSVPVPKGAKAGEMVFCTSAITLPSASPHGDAPIVADGWNGPGVCAYVCKEIACTFVNATILRRVRFEIRQAGSASKRTWVAIAAEDITAGTVLRFEWRLGDAQALDVFAAWGKAWLARFAWPDARGIVADMMPGNGRTLREIATAAVAKAKQDNAQAVVYWNLYEPESGLKYLGQPSLLPSLREWASIADLRKIHTDAGVRVGVCIRPWKMTIVGGKLVRDEAADNVQALIDEARWAQANMGATVFYVDCAGDIGVRGADRLQAALPNVLFLWEASGPGWSRYGWPMTECNAPGIRGETDRRCYPAARSALLHPDALSDADLMRLHNAGDRPIIEPWSDVRTRLKSLLGKEPW